MQGHERLASAPETRAAIAQAMDAASQDPVARLMAGQLTLARALPDYWQRFEDARTAYVSMALAEDPGGAGVGSAGGLGGPSRPPISSRLLGRLLGRR